MSLFKIALKNIRKSIGDYTVYFLTLIIGVSIFYMFNSIGTQGIMQDVMKSGSESVQMLVNAISGVSVAVAAVLGLLIIYANNFLIRRRKKEFGIYMLLGMNRKKVSKILVCETCMVGILSLAAGLVVGIFGSQLLSIIVAKMFAVDVTAYKFAVSDKALVTTLVSFLAIYLIVLLFNTGMVSKYKLIDLINAEKATEKRFVKNTGICVVLFVISVGLLIAGYVRIGFYGADLSKNQFIVYVLMIVVGTFILFWSLAGFFQKALSMRKSLYKKGLNSFVIRQFSANMNTSAFSMAMISILLMAAICSFSSGFSFRTYLNKRLANATPVDLSMRMWDVEPDKYLKDNGMPLSDWTKDYYILPVYESNELTIGDTVGPMLEEARKTFMHADWSSTENVMKLSDYNKLERMYGRKELKLEDDEYAIVSDFDLLNTFLNPAIKQGNELEIAGAYYKSAYNSVIYEYVLMSGLSADMGVAVLPDHAVEEMQNDSEEISYLLIADYATDTKQGRYEIDAKLTDILGEISDATISGDQSNTGIEAVISTKNQVEDASIGTSVVSVFLVLYIGIVFVVSCAAILALKIMSDCIDSAPRFRILSRIGAGEDMRKRALFIQVLLNFILPFVSAVIGSVFCLRYIRGLLSTLGMVSLGSGMAFTAVIMAVVYGGYFLTTYEGCKKLI